MIWEILQHLRAWSELDSAIALTAALAAMSCALPGVWLVLRRNSMLADALSHAALPGVVSAFFTAYALRSAGWVPSQGFPAVLQICIILGAIAAGLTTAWLTDLIQRLGRIDSGAALGVVFTCLFALGLVMVRLLADDVHLDPDCVLFGILEATALDTISKTSWIPRAAVANGIILLVNLALTGLFFKELRLAAFDPALAKTQGIPAGVVHYTLLAATAVAAATAFSTVGSILVIGLLIVPAATAQLLTTRLWVLVLISMGCAGLCALLGQAAAISLAGPIFRHLGFPEIRDAGTSGMIAVVSGALFLLAIIVAPRHGLLTRVLDRFRVSLRIAADDTLGRLYRNEEDPGHRLQPQHAAPVERIAGWWLARRGLLRAGAAGRYELTAAGRTAAQSLVRSHRLWESYLDRNFPLPPDQLHLAADRAEHFLDRTLSDALAAEVPTPERDPHGREIPEAPEEGR